MNNVYKVISLDGCSATLQCKERYIIVLRESVCLVSNILCHHERDFEGSMADLFL